MEPIRRWQLQKEIKEVDWLQRERGGKLQEAPHLEEENKSKNADCGRPDRRPRIEGRGRGRTVGVEVDGWVGVQGRVGVEGELWVERES